MKNAKLQLEEIKIIIEKKRNDLVKYREQHGASEYRNGKELALEEALDIIDEKLDIVNNLL